MRTLISILLLTLAGCSTLPQSTQIPRRMPNACVPQAIAMSAGLAKHGIQAEVLVMLPKSETDGGHAVAAYKYKNRKWAWDQNLGTVELISVWHPYWLGLEWWQKWGSKMGIRGDYWTAKFIEAGVNPEFGK